MLVPSLCSLCLRNGLWCVGWVPRKDDLPEFHWLLELQSSYSNEYRNDECKYLSEAKQRKTAKMVAITGAHCWVSNQKKPSWLSGYEVKKRAVRQLFEIRMNEATLTFYHKTADFYLPDKFNQFDRIFGLSFDQSVANETKTKPNQIRLSWATLSNYLSLRAIMLYQEPQ